MVRFPWIIPLAAACALASTGCQTHYDRLRLRPVDTSSQLTLEGVRVAVAKPGGPSTDLGVTDSHGQIEIANLRSGQILTLSLDGFEPVIIMVRPGGYAQKSPMSLREWTQFSLAEGETIPVPMHRVGQVRRPAQEPPR